MVTRERVRQRPKHVYQQLREVVLSGKFDRVGYHLEYSWHVIMGEPWLQPLLDPQRLCGKAATADERESICYFTRESLPYL
jgi:hypothetical protein